MNITEEDVKTLKYILSLTTARDNDVMLMQNFMVKYIDNKTNICKGCPSQIKFAYQRMKMWYAQFKEEIEQGETNIKPKNNNGTCIVCGSELDDKRKSYCSKECKDKNKKK